MRTPALLACLAALLVPPAASADSGFAVRARPAGLDFIGAAVKDRLPTRFDIPDYDAGVAVISQAEVELAYRTVELIPRAGAIEVHAAIDLDASAFLDSSFGDCDLRVTASPIDLRATVSVANGANGRIEATGVMVEVGLTADQFDFSSQGCVIGDIVEAVLTAAEDWVLDKATGLLEDVAEEKILPMVEDALEMLGALELEAAGFQLQGRVTGVDIDPGRGLTAAADGQIVWAGPTAPGLIDPGPPAVEPAIGVGLPNDYAWGAFALAASDDRATQAVHQAWRGGMFQTLLGGLAPSIELSGDGLAQKLGLPDGTTVDVGIDVTAPPTVGFGRGPDATGVRIALREVRIDVTIAAPGATTGGPGLSVMLDGTLLARVTVQPGLGALQIDPTDLIIERLELTTDSQNLDVDPARLREFVRAVVVPMLGETIRAIPIAPAIRPMDDIFAVVRNVTTQGGWLRAGLDLYRPDPNDRTNPDTDLIDPARIVSPALASFVPTGTDDTTPRELLRYLVRLDGVLLDEEPAFMAAIRVSTADGNHLLEVQAVDLSGRIDPTPIVHSFVVDGVPPELELLEAPAQVLRSERAHLAWRASDDRTAADRVQTRWELRKMIGAEPVVVASEDFAANRSSVDLPTLEDGALYVVEIVARDEAGNVTSVEHGLLAEQSSGGCSLGAGTRGGAGVLVLLLVGLLATRRRCATLAAALAVAALGVGGTAHAQGVGTTLSGPTDGDGAAAFWNPAAMTRSHATRVELGSGVSLIRASYQPMERTEGSHTFVPKPEPTFGAVTDVLGSRVRAGLTVGVPQIDGASWSRDDAAADITRWYAVDARTFHVTVTPALAYKPTTWLSVGAGIDIVHSRIEASLDKDMGKQLNQAAGSPVVDSPFPYGDASMAAPADLEARGWAVGAVAGVMLEPHPRVRFGASVHLPTETRARGTMGASYPDAMVELVREAAPDAELPPLEGDIEVPLTLPLMTFAALAVEPARGWELRADYRFLQRSRSSDLNIEVVAATSPDVKDSLVVRGYDDRHSLGLRVATRFLEGRGLLAARARIEPNTVPEETVAPNNVDFDKLELGIAARYLLSPRVAVVGMYSHYFMPSRLVDESLHRPLTEPSLDAFNHPAPTGTYAATADYLAFVLSVAM
ncbi:MAG TPA: outer membrane protein transport protein [Kofleriaceae bacterium]|nr:outer membrane protein transport protein [Kofleriaceae bacterium]